MDKHLQACSPEFFDRPFFIVHGYDETMSELLHGLEGGETKKMVCKTGVRSIRSQHLTVKCIDNVVLFSRRRDCSRVSNMDSAEGAEIEAPKKHL